MSIKLIHTLLSNQDVAGNGTPVEIVRGGYYMFMAHGTFDGATVGLSILGPNGTDYITLVPANLTAAGIVTLGLAAGSTVRGTLTGGTNPEDIFASLSYISEG